MIDTGETKKYYWLKLKDDFFRDKKIKKLRRIAGGDTFTIIYLKMQLLSIKNGGTLHFDGIESDFAEELALDLDEDVENVRMTLAFLRSNDLIEECENDNYLLPEAARSIGSEVASAERIRRFREKQAKTAKTLQSNGIALQSNGIALQCNGIALQCNTEIDIEKREKIKDIEIETHTPDGDGVSVSDQRQKSMKEDNIDTAFETFWSEYPKHINRNGCYKAFKGIKRVVDQMPEIMLSLEKFKRSQDWQKENGKYIPYPLTWLHQERWKDEQSHDVATSSFDGDEFVAMAVNKAMRI